MRPGSRPYSLGWRDVEKLAIGAALSITGALSAWFASEAVPMLKEDGGVLALVVAAVVPILLNALRKFLSDTRE